MIIHYSLLITYIQAEKTAFEIGHFRTFQTSLTLTYDRVIRHTVVHHSSTSIYIQNFVDEF